MLRLSLRLQQVVVTDAILDRTDVLDELLGKRQRPANQAGHPLPYRVVETLHVMGFAGQRADRLLLGGRNHTCVSHILLGMQRRLFTVRWWDLGP